ncbi:hypothetical protein [Flammeovirga aprica]|uniref:Uncharacterized protein n=1 Tax=Flammeovirga aprica JL-4 TaxID=694437 RepID=A0A7X9RYV4_9BACT|nr:hypothetical protein [Flammeovirga aprica]NME71243.1 hypothetical protein [Flammeovirga aprica JL-4]
MKKRRNYQTEAHKLAKAIDIAIEAFTEECPSDFNKKTQSHMISCYTDYKDQCLNPEVKYRNLASLKYIIEAVFTYFQEGTGNTIEYFWKRIHEENLEYVRENRLEKILTRGKIRGRIEFDYVTDMIVVAEQVGLTTKEDTTKLSIMLGEYEERNL